MPEVAEGITELNVVEVLVVGPEVKVAFPLPFVNIADAESRESHVITFVPVATVPPMVEAEGVSISIVNTLPNPPIATGTLIVTVSPLPGTPNT